MPTDIALLDPVVVVSTFGLSTMSNSPVLLLATRWSKSSVVLLPSTSSSLQKEKRYKTMLANSVGNGPWMITLVTSTLTSSAIFFFTSSLDKGSLSVKRM